jgi:hypothetical protein
VHSGRSEIDDESHVTHCIQALSPALAADHTAGLIRSTKQIGAIANRTQGERRGSFLATFG